MSHAAISLVSADIAPLLRKSQLQPLPGCPLHFSRAKPTVDWFSKHSERMRGGAAQSKLLSGRPEFESQDFLDFHLSLEAAFSSPDVTLQEVSALDPNTTLSAEFSLGHYLTASGKQGFGYECPA